MIRSGQSENGADLKTNRFCIAAIVLGVIFTRAPLFAADGDIELSPMVARLLESDALTDAERRRQMIFHGQWYAVDVPTPAEQALIALHRYDLHHEVFADESVPPITRAQAAGRRGDPAAVIKLLEADDTPQAAVLRSEAQWQLGRLDLAIAAVKPYRDELTTGAVDDIDNAADLVAVTDALIRLAILEGRPSDDYKVAMTLLSKAHQQLDRLYWPAKLAEAELLIEKDNARQAVDATVETLRFNPRCGQAWYLLGRVGLQSFSFDQADKAIGRLRDINQQHLLADLLEIHMRLQQKDTAAAKALLTSTLSRYPHHRELLALNAAAGALAFDPDALADGLAAFDAVAPNHPLAHFIVGQYLSRARQYPSGEYHLRQAIARFANWSPPRIELGLLLMQSGDEPMARRELAHASRLDPFHRQAANQLKLVEDLLSYEQIETEHFIIKFRPGIDRALATQMPAALEQIYDDVTSVFEYQPPRKTLIEILPDDQHLAVRIIGMPEIWTIGACTGDVIAITPPRQGRKQRGPFDWENVIRHEFVHTVTLNQTHYRIPHWFTEACAVALERKGRDYTTCQLLAQSLQNDKLFDLTAINWAFVRPKTPADRPLAYAQAHWMHQYLVQTYGHGSILRLLALYRDGVANERAIEQVTGRAAAQFTSEFRTWAAEQVKSWGLDEPTPDARFARLASADADARATLLAKLTAEYPEHPDLLRYAAAQVVAAGPYDAARDAIMRYAASRPVDPWSNRMLVQLALPLGRANDAVGPLQDLDRGEATDGRWAAELARIHRAAARLDHAAAAITRAIFREPYNANYRETAAAIALQRGDLETALRQVTALTILEPDIAIQWTRLAAVHHKLGRVDEAKEAARKAKTLDPDAPVGHILGDD